MTQQVFVPQLKKHQKKSLASKLRIELSQYTPKSTDKTIAIDLTQYLHNRIIVQSDMTTYYKLAKSQIVVSAATLKSIFYEYFDNVLPYDAISNLFHIPEPVIKQLINLAY